MADSDDDFRAAFTAWLVSHGTKVNSIPDFLDGFCRCLNGFGYGIRRCNLATRTVHPQMVAIRHVWSDGPLPIVPINPAVVVSRRQYRIDEAMIDVVFFNAMNEKNPQYLASPFHRIESCKELYEAIRPPGENQSFPIFDDLAKAGCTGYYGLYLDAFAGSRQQIGLATTVPGGLSPQLIEDLRWSLRLFTLHLNTLMEYGIKNTLARTYLGDDPGQRVCDGMIGRGEVVTLDAAIWFSDLRGFTATSERLEAEALLQMLNDYFEVVVSAIYEEGGEVLKYIGDAILAIFPVTSFEGSGDACRAALAAARNAGKRLEELNAERLARREAALNHGVALHLGNAQYGNIGSLQRLDFTLIGREVNVASRLEGLTKQLGETILCSRPFAEASGVAARALGRFPLKGVGQPIEVMAPINDPAPQTRK